MVNRTHVCYGMYYMYLYLFLHFTNRILYNIMRYKCESIECRPGLYDLIIVSCHQNIANKLETEKCLWNHMTATYGYSGAVVSPA